MDDRVRGLGATLARFSYLPIAAVLLASILGMVFSAGRPATYEARARLVFAASKEFDPYNLSPSYDVQRFLVNQAELVESRPVLDGARSKLSKPPSVEELMGRISAFAQKDGGVVVVTATAATGREAADLVNKVTEAYSAYIRTSNMDVVKNVPVGVERAATQKEIATKAALYDDGLALREQAQPSPRPISPQPTRDAVFLGLFAGLATVALLIAWHLLEPRTRGARSIAQRLDVPIIADTPSHKLDVEPGPLTRGMAGVYAAGAGAPLVLLVVTPSAPEDADRAAQRLAEALRLSKVIVSVLPLEALNDPESTQVLRRQAAVTLISASDIVSDYRIIAHAKSMDGIIVMTKPAAKALALDATRRTARQADIPVVGVVVDDYDTPIDRRSFQGTASGSSDIWRTSESRTASPQEDPVARDTSSV